MVYSLTHCTSKYNCAENFGIIAIIVALGILFFRAYSKIKRDSAYVMDTMDKIVFRMAFAQVILLGVFYTFHTANLFLSTVKIIRLC